MLSCSDGFRRHRPSKGGRVGALGSGRAPSRGAVGWGRGGCGGGGGGVRGGGAAAGGVGGGGPPRSSRAPSSSRREREGPATASTHSATSEIDAGGNAD